MTTDRSEYLRQYYQKNKVLIAEKQKAAREANPERRRGIMKKYRDNNKEKIREYNKKDRIENPEKYNERQRLFYAENKELRYSYYKNWYNKNRQGRDAYGAERRASKKTATPSWVDRKSIRSFYCEARRLGLTVDHIVPLKHPLVCGLHVPWNLQFMSHSDNSRKTNTFEVAA